MDVWQSSYWYTRHSIKYTHRHDGVNTLRPRQNGHQFPDDNFKCIFWNEDISISINISLKFVPKGPISNIVAIIQIRAWRQAIIWTNEWLVYWRIYDFNFFHLICFFPLHLFLFVCHLFHIVPLLCVTWLRINDIYIYVPLGLNYQLYVDSASDVCTPKVQGVVSLQRRAPQMSFLEVVNSTVV